MARSSRWLTNGARGLGTRVGVEPRPQHQLVPEQADIKRRDQQLAAATRVQRQELRAPLGRGRQERGIGGARVGNDLAHERQLAARGRDQIQRRESLCARSRVSHSFRSRTPTAAPEDALATGTDSAACEDGA